MHTLFVYKWVFSFFPPLGPLGLIIVWHFPKKCGNASMLRSVKNTVLLFINMSISWWKLYDRTLSRRHEQTDVQLVHDESSQGR